VTTSPAEVAGLIFAPSAGRRGKKEKKSTMTKKKAQTRPHRGIQVGLGEGVRGREMTPVSEACFCPANAKLV